jgi:hypothetical protein
MDVAAIESTQTVLEEGKEFRVVEDFRGNGIVHRWLLHICVVERR